TEKKYDDKVIISKGHAASCLYPILAEKGVIQEKDWLNWGTEKESILKIFGNTSIPGIDATSGSLGHGLGIGAGYALSFKKRNLNKKVFVIISEGELYEGSVWETLMFANHQNLNNLHLIIDRNNLMILGDTEDCVKLEPIKDKIESFGFETTEINGHDYSELLSTYDKHFINNKNCNCIIANTIKGKGIKQFENNAKWHYWSGLSTDEENKILKELNDI
ncbi:transketolase, partial [Alphaproteobacteria bacterium]|nr:transketolase [Alphaproteobacteria bacterium]